MKSLTYVETDIDYCELTYGQSPCTARLGFADGTNPNTVLFDGTNDYLKRGAGLTGAVDSKQFTFSVWVKRHSTTLAGRFVSGNTTLGGGSGTLRGAQCVLSSVDNTFAASAYNSAGTVILNIGSVGVIPSEIWTHIICSFDLSDTNKRHIYIDGVSDLSSVTYTNDTIDFTIGEWSIGAWADGNRKLNADIAELWFAPGVYIDLSVEANRELFRTSVGAPVYLGANGELPTGTAPLVYLANPFGTFQTNLGTGGDFTVTGTLSAGGTFGTGSIKCFNCWATCQDQANYSEVGSTLRFAVNTDYLPADIECIPSIKSINFTPAIVSLGKNLGQRASLSVEFRDHKHPDTGDGFDKYASEREYNPYDRGTFWGRFRARHPFLQGHDIRVIRGVLGDDLTEMETRNYIIESTEGPSYEGSFSISAKDVLKLADGDRAQAPAVSEGTLSADLTAVATSMTLVPVGIGSTYPASGHINLSSEVVSFTRVGDVFTITRAQLNTVAATHTLGDRAQLVLSYVAQDPATIISDLLQTYANVPSVYIPLSSWLLETGSFLGRVYTGYVTEPTSVNKLISEIIDIAALAVWWDDREQLIRLQVLRQISSSTATYTDDDRIERTLKVKEQPEERLSQVWTYFGKRDPTKNEDELDNYTSVAKTVDTDAETDYGTPAILKRFTRWIPLGGSSAAQGSNEVLLSRYRDPPRRFNFSLFRQYDPLQDPTLGGGYQLEAYNIQDETGARLTIPIQITRLNPQADRYDIEAEEMQATTSAPAERIIIIDVNTFNVNLRTLHDTLYSAPQTGNTVTLIIQAGVIVGSSSTSLPAIDIGSWPAGVTINVQGEGRIEGAGGNGGGLTSGILITPAGNGGTALYTRYAIQLMMTGGIWSGGGGGGIYQIGSSYYAGGGGGGAIPGVGGEIPGSNAGNPGTNTAGGTGGFGVGGSGGAPGSNGTNGNFTAGGAKGNAIDGISYCTISSPAPDIRGTQVN